MSAIGADNFGADDVQKTDVSLHRFESWASRAMIEIAARKTGMNEHERRNSVGDWRFPEDLQSWRTAMDADFVLTSFFRDTRETTARKIVGPLSGVTTYYKQVGVACVVDLRDGQMVWCNLKSDAWTDLQKPDVAAKAIWELLRTLTSTPTAESPKKMQPTPAPGRRPGAGTPAPTGGSPPPPGRPTEG